MSMAVNDILKESPQIGAEGGTSEEDEVQEGLDVFSLKHPPPKWTYTAQAQFYYAGRGKPSRYDFDDDLPDDGGK
ncbi:MAG: hypothetical protein MOB07_26580 [Acidobacteria bacterium]|nr:hypothetical protein [Acidobacteriota bacterium]